jgi:hypothetical protein
MVPMIAKKETAKEA